VNNETKTARWLRGTGVEIGAHTRPIEGIRPIYVDKFKEYAGDQCLADYYGDASSLPFHDNSLDYVASSHVLEHVANPIRALCEWYRVLRPGGVIYMIVPDRRLTFDHGREVTTVEHMFQDYLGAVTDCDPTHIDEFMDRCDMAMHSPSLTPEERDPERERLRAIYHAEIGAGREINIHCHVFEPHSVRELLERLRIHPATRLRLSIVDHAERFPDRAPNGFLFVVSVHKTWRDWVQWARQTTRTWTRPSTYPLLPSARRVER
jgi:SAM-dependent methyltransferase